MALATTLLISPVAYSAEDSAQEAAPIKQYNSKIGGNFNVRTWLGSNSVDQFITLTGGTNSDGFINSKQSMTMLEIESNYWFGYVTQSQLSTLGPLFGIGVDFSYGKNSFTNISLASDQGLTADIVTYLLDLAFVKFALVSDSKLSRYVSLSGHYTSYSNSLSGSSPLNGLGVGLEAQYNFADTVDTYFKLNYIPSANSIRLSSVWGANSELGLRWYLSPRAAINVSYKALYYNGKASGQTQAQNAAGTATNINYNINIQDFLYGINMGGSYFF